MNSPTDTPPSTGTAPVQSVATVVRLLGDFSQVRLGGPQVLARVSREPIVAIDFYPATPTTTQGETSAL